MPYDEQQYRPRSSALSPRTAVSEGQLQAALERYLAGEKLTAEEMATLFFAAGTMVAWTVVGVARLLKPVVDRLASVDTSSWPTFVDESTRLN